MRTRVTVVDHPVCLLKTTLALAYDVFATIELTGRVSAVLQRFSTGGFS